jgi:hypothetical protein
MSRTISAREHWQRIVAQQQGSGWGVADFCRRHAVAAASLYAWKRRLRREAGPTPGFVAVRTAVERAGTVPGAGPGAAIELHLGGGRWLVLPPGFDAQGLGQVLALLEGRA